MDREPETLSFEQLIRAVNQLPEDERERLRLKLNMAGDQPSIAGAPDPFLDWHVYIDVLAAQQGVAESTSVEGLKGNFWPEDEDLSEFIATVRNWRRQSSEQN